MITINHHISFLDLAEAIVTPNISIWHDGILKEDIVHVGWAE